LKNVRYYKHYRKPRSGPNGFLNAIICHWPPSSVYNNNASLAVPWWAKRYECPSPALYLYIINVFYPVRRYFFISIWARIIRGMWDLAGTVRTGLNPKYIFFVLFSRAGEFEKWCSDLLRKYNTSACTYTWNGPCFMRMCSLPYIHLYIHLRGDPFNVSHDHCFRKHCSVFGNISFTSNNFKSLQNNIYL